MELRNDHSNERTENPSPKRNNCRPLMISHICITAGSLAKNKDNFKEERNSMKNSLDKTH